MINREVIMFELIKEFTNMPIIFIGHGNPMYAISDNPFRQAWIDLGKVIPKPKAILCISAHWVSKGTYISSGESLKTIHDFYGFPQELNQANYDVNGNPQLADAIVKSLSSYDIYKDDQRGIDHGAWSVLANMFPQKDIPVIQLSLDLSKPNSYHLQLASSLKYLREHGVLIIGSGNIVHNLHEIKWENNSAPYHWAIDFDQFVENALQNNDINALIDFSDFEKVAKKAHPTIEHYLPLIYVLANRDENDKLLFFNNTIENSSISMKSVIFWE